MIISSPPEISCQTVFAVIQRLARLIDIGKLHGRTDAHFAGIGLFLAGDHAKHRGLAGAVRADDADDAASGQIEVQIVEQQPIAEAPS